MRVDKYSTSIHPHPDHHYHDSLIQHHQEEKGGRKKGKEREEKTKRISSTLNWFHTRKGNSFSIFFLVETRGENKEREREGQFSSPLLNET